MADPDSSLTPEQRLLKLIEEQEGKKGEGSAGAAAAGTKSKSLLPKMKAPNFGEIASSIKNLFSPRSWKSNFNSTGKALADKVKSAQTTVQLKQVNHVLKIVIGVFAVILAGNILWDMRFLGQDYRTELELSSGHLTDLAIIPETESHLSFFEGADVRNVFSPASRKEEGGEEKSELTMKILQKVQNLKLTGISVNPIDDKQTFCMIEDIEKSTTHFLKVGDSLSGIKVDQIKSDSIVLKFQDEVIELR